MKTDFITPSESAEALVKIANEMKCVGNRIPTRFHKIMEENIGAISAFCKGGPTADGLERRNPVIVALGDSVTAGHFEFLLSFEEIMSGKHQMYEPVEVTDSKESYVEKFRYKLIDKYERTSVSLINAGIAGDTIVGMHKRLQRDVICHKPDMVLINASLNWPEPIGGNDVYEKELSAVIDEVKKNTAADIILITPNMEIEGPFTNKLSSLRDRVEIIRRLAEEKQVCLADNYAVWEEYVKQGYDLKDILANGINHPSVVGHEVYAIVLLKLFS